MNLLLFKGKFYCFIEILQLLKWIKKFLEKSLQFLFIFTCFR